MDSASRPSLFGRAMLALMLTVGFYGLALLTAMGLLFLIYLEVVALHTVNIRLTLLALFGAVVILWSILIEMLNDSEREVQKQAIRCLGDLRDPRTVTVLQQVMANRGDRELHALAKEALDKIKPPSY